VLASATLPAFAASATLPDASGVGKSCPQGEPEQPAPAAC
jgi:hypothetical protein